MLAQQHEAAATRKFVLTLLSRSNPVTLILIGANVGMFALEWLAGGMGLMSADDDVLLRLGAKNNDLIVNGHQYWRLVSCMFLHIGFLHLLMNNYALWIIGQELERLYGSARFATVYVATGVLASLSSFYFSPNATSAGASGAIFGLFGVLAVFGFKYRKEIPNALSKSIRGQVLPIIAINLVIGFQAGIVDNAAHIGGLLSGIALAFVISYRRPAEHETPLIWRFLQLASVALLIASILFALLNFRGTPVAFANLTASPGSRTAARVEQYLRHVNGAMLNFDQSRRLLDRAASDSGQLRQAQEAVDKGIAKVESAPNLGAEAETYRKQLGDILRRQRRLIDSLSREDRDRPTVADTERSLAAEFAEYGSKFHAWVPGFLEAHGLVLKEPEPR